MADQQQGRGGQRDRQPPRWRIERMNIPDRVERHAGIEPELTASVSVKCGNRVPSEGRPDGQWLLDETPQGSFVDINDAGGARRTFPLGSMHPGQHSVGFQLVGPGYAVIDQKTREFYLPSPDNPALKEAERQTAQARLELERARIKAELTKLRAEPSSLEKQLAEAKLRRELTQINQELNQASQIRRADDWEIKVSGEDGKQTIRVAVFDAAKQPVPDWQVEIVGAGIDPPIRRTDADGIVELKMDFAEKSRGVHLFLRGTSKDHRLSLDGPVRDVSNKPFYVLGILNVILLVVGLTMVGFNPSSWEVKLTAPPSEIAQRYQNEYRFGKFKTDAELDREGIKVQRPQPKMVSGFVKWYWRGFWASIIVMIVCFFAVFRDDARRSWRRAKQSITRKYGVGEVDIREGRASLGETLAAIKQGQQTGGQSGATPTGEQALTSRQFWRVYPIMELGISFLSDMVSNAVFHRKSA
ncbi:hypothetical protein HY374_00565 [Candidatus Berkelbacteria bacterium]|nr:hypothetical protein [Candidatus Berkelbacteria bacterium]